ncbi:MULTISPECIES: restriction endonuclease subunit S [Methylobacter]
MNVVFFGFKRQGMAFLDSSQAHDLRNAEVQASDVLLNITGASIGRVTIAPQDMEGARVNQHVCIIRPKPEILSEFLCWFFAAPEMQRIIDAENYGVTRQALTKQQILNFEISLPSIEEQTEIVAQVEQLFDVSTLFRTQS